MSRERDAIEEIRRCLSRVKLSSAYSYKCCYEEIEQILTIMEDLIQEDLEKMSMETPILKGGFILQPEGPTWRQPQSACPLFEAMNLDQTNTKEFWEGETLRIRGVVEGIRKASPLNVEFSASDKYHHI